MLPPAAYTSDAVFAWEQANILSGWICVGHAADLGEPASQRAVDTGNGGVLLTRDEQGVARAFANTCRHRGHELLPCGGSRKARSIVCPYHSWSYKLDGTLRAAPGFRDVPGFDPGEFGLVPVPVAEWHGYLFVDPSGTAGDFADHLPGLDEVIGGYRPEDLVVVATHSYELATNWKVIVENYQECYHCSTIHPELSRISPPDSGATIEPRGDWLAGWMDLIPQATTMSLDGRSDGRPIAGLSETELRTVMYVVAYPNLLISLHPDYVMTHVMRPLAADRTQVECAWAFPREVARAGGLRPLVRGRLLGPDQPAGLGRVRVGAARAALQPRPPGADGAGRGRRPPVRHAGGAGVPGQRKVGRPSWLLLIPPTDPHIRRHGHEPDRGTARQGRAAGAGRRAGRPPVGRDRRRRRAQRADLRGLPGPGRAAGARAGGPGTARRCGHAGAALRGRART